MRDAAAFMDGPANTRKGGSVLVLTRKIGEVFRVGDDVKVTVLEVRSGQVKLGIEAPRDVRVNREEIYARIFALSGRIDGAGRAAR